MGNETIKVTQPGVLKSVFSTVLAIVLWQCLNNCQFYKDFLSYVTKTLG